MQGWAERVEVVKQYRVLDVRGCLGDGQDGWSGRAEPPDPAVWQPPACLGCVWHADATQRVPPGDMAGETPAPPAKVSGAA